MLQIGDATPFKDKNGTIIKIGDWLREPGGYDKPMQIHFGQFNIDDPEDGTEDCHTCLGFYVTISDGTQYSIIQSTRGYNIAADKCIVIV